MNINLILTMRIYNFASYPEYFRRNIASPYHKWC